MLAGALFATVNALLEEVVWRGVMQDALAAQLGLKGGLLAQAVVFGVIHAQGFPRGLIGILLASTYGLLLGMLRLRSGGIVAPIIAHVCADATIFAIVVVLVGPG